MSNRLSSVAGLLLAIAVAVPAAPALAGSHDHDRQGLVLGFNLGLGGAKVEWEDDGFLFESDTETGGAVFFSLRMLRLATAKLRF